MALRSSVSSDACRRWRRQALHQQTHAFSRQKLRPQQQFAAGHSQKQRILILLVQPQRQPREIPLLRQLESRQLESRQQRYLQQLVRGWHMQPCTTTEPRQQVKLQKQQRHATPAHCSAGDDKCTAAPDSAGQWPRKQSACSSTLHQRRRFGPNSSSHYYHCRRNSIFGCSGGDCTGSRRRSCRGRDSSLGSSHSSGRRCHSSDCSSRRGSSSADHKETCCSSTSSHWSGKQHGSGRCCGSFVATGVDVKGIHNSHASVLGSSSSSSCLQYGTDESRSTRSSSLYSRNNRYSSTRIDRIHKKGGPYRQIEFCGFGPRFSEGECSRQGSSTRLNFALPSSATAELRGPWPPAPLLDGADAGTAAAKEAPEYGGYSARSTPHFAAAGGLSETDIIADAGTAAPTAEAARPTRAASAAAYRGLGGVAHQQLLSLLPRQIVLLKYSTNLCDAAIPPVRLLTLCGGATLRESSRFLCAVAAQARMFHHVAAGSSCLGGTAADREGDTPAARPACQIVTETSLNRAANAAVGKGTLRRREAVPSAAARPLAADTAAQRVALEAPAEDVASECLPKNGRGLAAEAGDPAGDFATGAATASGATGSGTKPAAATQVNVAPGNQREREAPDGGEAEDEYAEGEELFINPLCMQMEQRLLQCESAEDVLTLLVSHRGVLFLKNLVTALEVLADFAGAAGGAGSSNRRESNSGSRRPTTSSSVNLGSSKSADTDDSRSIEGSSTTGRGGGIPFPRGDEDGNTREVGLQVVSNCQETGLVDQGVLGRYLEGPVPRGWPCDRISYRELFSYLNTEEKDSSSSSSSSGAAAQTPPRRAPGITRGGQPESAWILQDERYEVLLDDLRFHRRSLSFEAAARVVLALRRLNHRHYGLLSAMLHPLAKRAIPVAAAPSTAAAEALPQYSPSTSSSDAESVARGAPPCGTVDCVPPAATSPAEAANGAPANLVVGESHKSSACSPLSLPAVQSAYELEMSTRQQQRQPQRQQLLQRQDLYRAIRMQRRYEQAAQARTQQLLRCAGVYVWAGYTQHPFFDRVVRLFAAALRPRVHEELTLSLTRTAPADAAAQMAMVLTNCPTLLVDCLRVFSSLQVSQVEHAHIAAAAAQLLLSNNKRLLFMLSPDDTATLVAAVAELPPLLHMSPCMRMQEPCAAVTQQQLNCKQPQQLLHAPDASAGIPQLQQRSTRPQLLPRVEARRAPELRREQLWPHADSDEYQQVLQEQQQHLQQGQQQQQDVKVRPQLAQAETPQQWHASTENQQQHQLPSTVQEQCDTPRPLTRRASTDQQWNSLRGQTSTDDEHVEAVDRRLTQSANGGTCTEENETQHMQHLTKSALLLQADAGRRCSSSQRAAAQVSTRQVSSPVGGVSAAVLPPPPSSTVPVAAHLEMGISAEEPIVGFSSISQLISHQQRSSPVLALLWAAADYVERHFAAFTLAAVATVLSSLQRQQLLFPLCILRGATRAAAHLRLAANTRQEAQISVAEVGKLLHACTFFGLSTLSRPASAVLCTSSAVAGATSSTATAVDTTRASAPSTAVGEILCDSSPLSMSPSSHDSSCSSFSSVRCASSTRPLCTPAADGACGECVETAAGWAAPRPLGADFHLVEKDMCSLPGGSKANEAAVLRNDDAAAAARSAEEVSAAASAVAALCDSAAAYLEQHLDDIEEETAIQVCYALVAVRGATARHGYLLSHVYRKIGKGTAWEKQRVLVFQLWLSQLLQFPSLSYNMPRRCVFEGLRAWCMQRGGYGAPWPEEVNEISSLLKRMHVCHRTFARPPQGGPYEVDILLQAPNLENTAMLVTTESAKNAFEPAGGTALQQQHLSLLAGITRVACVNRVLWKNLPTRACKILLLLQILQWLSFWAEKKSTSAALKSSSAASRARTA